MPETGLPQYILFLFFLVLFVVTGIYPAWKRLAERIRIILGEAAEETGAGRPTQKKAPADGLISVPDEPLSDFELFILNHLAQQDKHKLTRKQLNANLHLEPEPLKTGLKSLARKGFISLEISSFFQPRYALTDKGYRYAVEQGFITPLQATGS